MLVALVGVTGVGKSYFKDRIVEKLGFKQVNTIRTREKRKGEKNGKTGLFMSKEEVDELEKQDKIAYRFGVFGGEYAYLKDEIYSEDDYIFEMHYTTIDDWKRVRNDIKTIYIFPTDIQIPIEKAKERNLSKEKELERIAELQEQYEYVKNNIDFQNKFDYIFYNNYDQESEIKLIELIKEIKNKNG